MNNKITPITRKLALIFCLYACFAYSARAIEPAPAHNNSTLLTTFAGSCWRTSKAILQTYPWGATWICLTGVSYIAIKRHYAEQSVKSMRHGEFHFFASLGFIVGLVVIGLRWAYGSIMPHFTSKKAK